MVSPGTAAKTPWFLQNKSSVDSYTRLSVCQPACLTVLSVSLSVVRDGGLTCLSVCLSCSLSVWPGSRLHTCPVQRGRLRLGARRHPRPPHWHPCRYLPRLFAPVSPICLTRCVSAHLKARRRERLQQLLRYRLLTCHSHSVTYRRTHTRQPQITLCVCVRVCFPTFCHMLTEVKPLTN